MKGTVFQKPYEFNIVTQGESWRQGAPISGTLTIKNHGSEPLKLSDVGVHLASGTVKKVHARDPKAFDLLETRLASEDESKTLAGGQSTTVEWSFPTDRNAVITYTTEAPYLVYGLGKETEKMGNLQLAVHPTVEIEEFLKTLQVGFRFVLKILKTNSKGQVEAKLAPPDGKGFSAIEFLFVGLKYSGDDLEIDFNFHTKKVEATASTLAVAKGKRTHSVVLGKSDYLVPSGRINFDKFEAVIQEALKGSDPF